MHRDGEKKPGLVPFPRFFAVLGYGAFCCVVMFILAEAASRVALPIYYHFKYPFFRPGSDSGKLLSQRRGIGRFGGWFFGNRSLDASSASPAYLGYPWAEDFWRDQRARYEFENSRPAPYEAFRVWGMAESHSKYFNVDQTKWGARRRSANVLQPDCESRLTLQVWVFGASTTYGYGTPDFATIPSFLSKKLNAESGRCVEVTNLGVDGYNSNQEAIYLGQQLKAGGRPDAVIFYDGYSDAYVGTIGPGIPATHWFYNEIKAKQESSILNWPDIVERSDFLHIIQALRLRIHRRRDTPLDQEVAGRVRATIDNYLSNLRLVRVLAREYGFEAFFFWQPYVLYGNKPLCPFEQSLYDDKSIYAVYQEADRRAKETGNYVFLGRVFDRVKDPVYNDSVHLGPLGNEIIAGAMALQIQPVLSTRKALPAEGSKQKSGTSP